MEPSDVERWLPGGDAVREPEKKVDVVEEITKAMEPDEPKAGERRSASYAGRVKRWWNSRLHGSVRRPDPEGERRVECTVRDKAGRVVARAEGRRTRKRSARGAARAAAVGAVFKAARRRLPNLDAYEFTYKVLEG